VVQVQALHGPDLEQRFTDALQVLRVGADQMGAARNDDNWTVKGMPYVGQRVEQPGVAAAAEQGQSGRDLDHQ
jgi:hypothetical protein